MALYKIVPKNPYYFWSVMSLIMQVGPTFQRRVRVSLELVSFPVKIGENAKQTLEIDYVCFKHGL